MTSVTIHLDPRTEARLRHAAEELGRDIWELATCAVEETALDYFRDRPLAADPGRAVEQSPNAERALQ